MSTYQYEYKDSGGRLATGVLEASSLLEATSRVRGRGTTLVNVRPLPPSIQGVLQGLRSFNVQMGPSVKDILSFTSQLAVMIKAGISIREAIEGIANQAENPAFRRMLQQIKADVESGQPFSDALARHPKAFSPLYVNMVRASELSGSFGAMLERIGQYVAQQVDTRNMVRGAMIYPAIIATMAIGTTIFLLTWVLPRFTTIFAGKESLLPLPTVILLGLSDFLTNRWYIIVAVVAAMAGGLVWGLRTSRGRRWWDIFKLKVPIFKKMFRALYITRGLHTMGELVNAGVPMLQTLSITAEVSGNTLYRQMWQSVHAAVKQGEKIARPLSQQRLLPPNVVQIISAGEDSGKLGEVMRDVAEYYSKELRNTIKSVTAMIEPMMIRCMGALVGFIAMSVILPIFKMSSLVQ